MKIHEFQSKAIFAKYGVPIPEGLVATTPDEAGELTRGLGGKSVIKAQVHAGGRGKAGGVRLVSSADEAVDFASQLLGTNLVTAQTGSEGVPVRKILVEETIEVADEFYLAFLVDGSTEGVVAIASSEGGVDIEEVAESSPEKIIRISVDPGLGLQPFQGRKIAYALNIQPDLVRSMSSVLAKLYDVFVSNDCSLVEINPLVITKENKILAVDAKINIDDDALFRHKDLADLLDSEQEDPGETEARKFDINYVKLEGDVGCIVNGAGLAMATMDVGLSGGSKPANFLDIGGGADEEKVANALRIVLMDSDVKLVLINIFGGILRCDVAARGFVQYGKMNPSIMRHMVVRMLGTNADEGRKILSESGLNITLVNDLAGASKAISALL